MAVDMLVLVLVLVLVSLVRRCLTVAAVAYMRCVWCPWQFWEEVISSSLALAATLFIMIAFSFVPAVVVAFIVKEREASHNCKHQQMISGASVPAYWLANYTWDVFVYALPCACSIIVIHAFNIGAFTGTAQASQVVMLLFVGYGLAIMPFTYLTPRPAHFQIPAAMHDRATTCCPLLVILRFISVALSATMPEDGCEYAFSWCSDTCFRFSGSRTQKRSYSACC